jgi:hypothetical protein
MLHAPWYILVTWEVMGGKHDKVKKRANSKLTVEKIAIMFLY